MIELGCFDPDVTQAQCGAYLQEVEKATRAPLSSIADGIDKVKLRPAPVGAAGRMSVAEVQTALRDLGFFPGGKVDGICGYRTLSAIRLFQEYVRSVEKQDCVPDGRFGPVSNGHLQRWLTGGLRPNWTETVDKWRAGETGAGEYGEWLALLEKTKARYTASPNRMLQMVNGFNGATDTRKVSQWDFSPAGTPQLVGIRRHEATGKFDDILVLLIKGLVYKFQGSTEPGATSNPAGAPFLVQGQHDYRFGWHKSSYLALRPNEKGVLVVRSRNNMVLEDSDLDRGLEPNATINIHWAGRGMTADIKSWSEGCQVINGSVYINAGGDLVSCAAFAGVNQADLNANRGKTRGAYNVLADLVTALASDAPETTVRYTLLDEADLALAPALSQKLADARKSAIALMR
jgi:peptidoglycan hydrolase-like protein with peptidoglycan-binding domain